MGLPLQGTRVLDLGRLIAGPIAAQVLGDLGAEVIKIESPVGEPLRNVGGPVAPVLESAGDDRPYNRRPWCNELNRGKLDVVLDLTQEAGTEVFKRLVRISDIVIDNFSPRVMKNFGLDYEALKREQENIIMISVSAFGATGPYNHRRGAGSNMDAASGLTFLSGYADGPPIRTGSYFCDFFSGLHAAFAAVTALHHRRHTGRGQYIDVAMREVDTTIVGDALIDYTMNGRAQKAAGNRHPSMAPHGCYPCTGDERWIAIAIGSEEEWQRLVDVMGGPDWAKEPQFTTSAKRLENQDVLDGRLSAWTATRDRDEVMMSLQQAGVAAGAVQNVKEVLDNPQVKHRQFYSEVFHPEMGQSLVRNLPWKMPRTPVSLERPAPVFAQDNQHVFQEILGMTPPEVERLYEAETTLDVPRPAEAQ